METDVVKGVNNKDNWGFGQERATFPSMIGCLVVYPYEVIGSLA